MKKGISCVQLLSADDAGFGGDACSGTNIFATFIAYDRYVILRPCDVILRPCAIG